MTGKLEILWTPIPHRFITWGSEIALYEIQLIEQEVPLYNFTSVKLSETTCAHLLATNRNLHYVNSIDICPQLNSDLLLAVGLSNGRVVLSNFGPSNYDRIGLPGKELISVTRHGRQCNVVSFNPIDKEILAAGLDKFRADNSVLIWDVSKINVEYSTFNKASNSPEAKPLIEFGTSEMTNSLAWFARNSKQMVCGMNLKTIKIVDIRDPTKIVYSTATKAVFGICMDPLEDRRIASYCNENKVSIWDVRNFKKPFCVLPQQKPIMKIEWCPTKYNLLGVLEKDSNAINLLEIKEAIVGTEEVEPAVQQRLVTPSNSNILTSFCWHSSDESRFLCISASGAITDYTVFDRITLNWAASSSICWSYGRKTIKYVSDSKIDDISNKMKRRAERGYGLENDVYKNANMVLDDEILSNVWNWIHISGRLVEDGFISNSDDKHPGVLSVLKVDPTTNKSTAISVSWSDLGYPNCQGSAVYFKHDDRNKALSLCGWPTDNENFIKYINQLERENAYTRAAAIAVFNLKIKLAIEILNRSPNPIMHVVAMALAGFSDDKNSVWKEFCLASKNKLEDPYLKAIFSFLTVGCNNFDIILNEKNLAIDDKVGFACMFLPDMKLLEYLRKLCNTLTDAGNLDGLLLTGNNEDGVKLLQKYMDSTDDIQSTTLIAVRAFNDYGSQHLIKDWIEKYRELLDIWQMWYCRADFDIMLAHFRPHEKPPQQVFVSCNFCGKSISAYMHGLNRGRTSYSRLTGTPNKLSCCPNCRKPLPRCAICLMHLGTSIEDDKGSDFDIWFTWCQTCRHGGHASHIINWFRQHQECPVTNCNCKCMALDFPGGI